MTPLWLIALLMDSSVYIYIYIVSVSHMFKKGIFKSISIPNLYYALNLKIFKSYCLKKKRFCRESLEFTYLIIVFDVYNVYIHV